MRRSKVGLITLLLFALCLVAACSSKSGKAGKEGASQNGDVIAVSQGYETTAINVKLSKTEGEVDVEDKSGNSVEKFEGMFLRNGHRVVTNDSGYAYLTLDEAKAAKVGQLSVMEVRKETKELSLYLESGEMFFNVAKHLSADEAMNIRTSTMVTGIRGTAGFVRVIDFYTTEIYVLDGEVWVTVIDPITGAKKSAMVGAGQMATSAVFAKNANTSERVDIIIKSFSEVDVPAFVIEEISLNANLQGRLISANVLNTSTLIGGYREALIRDHEEGKGRSYKAEGEKEDYQRDDKLDEMFSVHLAASTTCSLTDPTLEQVQQALDDEQYDTVNVAGTFVFGDGSEGLTKLSSVRNVKRGWSLRRVDKTDGEVLTIPAGKYLNLNGKTAFGSTGAIKNYGILTNNGSFYVGGELNNIDEGQFINNGTVLTPEEEKEHEHMMVTDPEVKPTCTKDGYTKGSHCATCGEILEPQQVIPATGHKEQKLAAVASTCQKTGLTEGKKCSVCGEILVKQETIPLAEHVSIATARVEPSCTATGVAAGTKCKNCGKMLSGGETLPANGHTPEDVKRLEPSCTTAGHESGTQCSVCHVTLSGLVTIAALGHKEKTVAGYAPTHTQNGVSNGLTDGVECERCGMVLVEQKVIEEKHQWALDDDPTDPNLPEMPATCGQDGYRREKCTVCGLTNHIRIPATGNHNYQKTNDTFFNCEVPSEQTYVCTVCNDTKIETTPARAHVEYVEQAAVPPTCTTSGTLPWIRCQVCGAEICQPMEDPATGHDFGPNDVEYEYCANGCGERNPKWQGGNP
ncbi:MAG: FecR domain-containing protein [Lachnospiraceae bacterium]|nr:FecR domain-containing protein [Lachnospiraceae bacterium]